jgi:hypothetical protein
MAGHEREQIFGLGIALGLVIGFVVGSLLAMRLGDEALDLVARLLERRGRGDNPNFELLLG